MNELNLNKATMSSLELLKIINDCRVSAGESKLDNRKFLIKVEDELDLNGRTFFPTVPEGGGTPMRTYTLTLDDCMLVGMRESKSVRRSVLAKLKELESRNAIMPAAVPILTKTELAQMVIDWFSAPTLKLLNQH